MSITLKQLEELANEYHFDVNEARRFLGNEPKKRGRPAKKDTDSDNGSAKCTGANCKKSPKANDEKPAGKRGPSGYNLFVKGQGVSIAEAAKQWKGLSDSARGKWNAKAKAMK